MSGIAAFQRQDGKSQNCSCRLRPLGCQGSPRSAGFRKVNNSATGCLEQKVAQFYFEVAQKLPNMLALWASIKSPYFGQSKKPWTLNFSWKLASNHFHRLTKLWWVFQSGHTGFKLKALLLQALQNFPNNLVEILQLAVGKCAVLFAPFAHFPNGMFGERVL